MSQPDYFDIHSHLNFPQYDTDRDKVIQKLTEENIWTITVGTSLETSREAVAFAEKYENLFATVGVHPAEHTSEQFDESEFSTLVKHPKVLAVGECGLDYARLEVDVKGIKRKQKEYFESQIELAISSDKPLMIHCRDAYSETLTILASKKREYGDKLRGNFHFFTSPIETARQCLEIGFTVSFTGPITYGSQYDEVVAFVPLEKMMAETDAPFAAPMPYRGKRNEPSYVVEVVKKIAKIKNRSLDEVKKILVNNAVGVFLRNPSSGPR